MEELCGSTHMVGLPFLSSDEMGVLAEYLEPRECKAGTVLFSRGDGAEEMFLLVSGKLAVQKQTGFNNKTQVVALLEPGAPIGERGLLGDGVRGATLRAVLDTELCRLSKVDFDNLSRKHPGLAIKILKWLLARTSLRLEKNSDRLAYIL